jgi:hypothetical protein
MNPFRKRKPEPTMSRADALKCIPVRNSQVSEERQEGGEAILAYPITVRPWFAGLVRRFGGNADGTRMKRLQLDALGTDVWMLLDGKRSVQSIVAEFAQKHRLHPKEAEVSVTQFLRQLGKHGIIGLK